MCGGPSSQQKAAANAQANLDTNMSNLMTQWENETTPFYENVLQKGLPYFNQESQYSTADIAKQINQAKANLAGRNAGFGAALPSGFTEAENADVDEAGAQMFDQNMLNLLNENFQAKSNAASAMNPLGPASVASSGNASIMNAPLQNNFWSNLLGGLISGAGQAFQGAGTAAVFG